MLITGALPTDWKFVNLQWSFVLKNCSLTYLVPKTEHYQIPTWKWATSWENLFLSYTNNKGANQPTHPCSLIRAFVILCLDSIIPLVSVPKISNLQLASVAEQAGLSLIWSQTEPSLFAHLKYGSRRRVQPKFSSSVNSFFKCACEAIQWG